MNTSQIKEHHRIRSKESSLAGSTNQTWFTWFTVLFSDPPDLQEFCQLCQHMPESRRLTVEVAECKTEANKDYERDNERRE